MVLLVLLISFLLLFLKEQESISLKEQESIRNFLTSKRNEGVGVLLLFLFKLMFSPWWLIQF